MPTARPCGQATLPQWQVLKFPEGPYAEYCTGNVDTSPPTSVCATFSGGQPVPGWFGIGGTSLSSPLVSAIVADRDSYRGNRAGNINPALYLQYRVAPSVYFHDVTARKQIEAERKRQLVRGQTLLRVVREFAGEGDPQRLVASIAEEAMRLLGGDQVGEDL